MAVLVVAGCKSDAKKPERLGTECIAALRAGDAGAALRHCRPCGVSFEPLVALSSTDPDEVPKGLPGPVEVLEILDACRATCQGTARTEVAELLRSAQDGHTPAAPWRRMAERCDGALRTDEHTLRYARGTLYALDQIARAIWADDAPAAAKQLRDSPPRFPLPPLTAASTGYAFPRVDAIGDQRLDLHVTISESQIHTGSLPWLVLTRDGPQLDDGVGSDDYPGDEISHDDLVKRIIGGRAALLIAPRKLRASRVLEVIDGVDASFYLATTPKTRGAEPWAEPVFSIPVVLATGPEGAEPLMLPASSTVADLAEALAKLAERKVERAYVTLDPTTSP
jgi:hypothetical protein